MVRSLGKKVYVVIPPPVPDLYAWLPGFDQILERPPAGARPHLVLFFDAGNLERSGSAARYIHEQAAIVNIDHHSTNAMFGDVNVIDIEASAVGQMVMQMLDAYGYPITASVATNLYTALMTDTGGFRHENTTAKVLEDASRLASLGADPSYIATKVYKSRPLTTLKLSALSIASMQVDMEGRIAWAKVTRRMLKEAQAVMAESEGIIDTLNSIAGLDLAILFKEVQAGLTKISVRSRGSVDAAALCAQFGGGGHLRAAGAEIEEPMDRAIAGVLAAASQMIGLLEGGHALRRPQPR